jgi:predicted RNase H-like HicB family nuclease
MLARPSAAIYGSRRTGATMDTYEIELGPAEPDGFAAIVPAVPGLLVLGNSVDEVLEHARAAIAFHIGRSADGRYTGQIKLLPRGAGRPNAA